MGLDNQLLRRGQSDDSSILGRQAGRKFYFDDYDYDNLPQRRSHHLVCCRLVKNSSGINLEPGRLVTFKSGTNRTEVDGYADETAEHSAVVVDEWLPSDGVPDGEYFYVAIHGPSEVLTSLAGGSNTNFSDDTVLVALTAASSGATSAGRIAPQDLTGATAPLANQVQGAIGRAMSGNTTAQTNRSVLAFLSNRWD